MKCKEFVEISKRIYDRKLSPACAGNMSIRYKKNILITPTGVSFCDVSANNVVEIDYEGNSLDSKKKPSMEKPLHLLIYKNREDVNAIIHTHTPYITACSMAGKDISSFPILEMKYLFKSNVPMVDVFPAGSDGLAKAVVKNIKESNAVILKNHGVVIVGKTLSEAYYTLEALEYVAQVAILTNISK